MTMLSCRKVLHLVRICQTRMIQMMTFRCRLAPRHQETYLRYLKVINTFPYTPYSHCLFHEKAHHHRYKHYRLCHTCVFHQVSHLYQWNTLWNQLAFHHHPHRLVLLLSPHRLSVLQSQPQSQRVSHQVLSLVRQWAYHRSHPILPLPLRTPPSLGTDHKTHDTADRLPEFTIL